MLLAAAAGGEHQKIREPTQLEDKGRREYLNARRPSYIRDSGPPYPFGKTTANAFGHNRNFDPHRASGYYKLASPFYRPAQDWLHQHEGQIDRVEKFLLIGQRDSPGWIDGVWKA